MKILSVSDRIEPLLMQRGPENPAVGVNLILGCGDLPPEYLTQLTSTLEAPLYYVMGDHDIRHASKPPEGCTDIHGRIVNFGGLRILGLGGSRWYNGGSNQYTENQMKWIVWRLYPLLWWNRGMDIVIAHAPPRRVRDAEDRCHRGFKSFHPLIKRFSPKYFIHGHIHAIFDDVSARMTTINRTRVINSYGYFILEIDTDGETG